MYAVEFDHYGLESGVVFKGTTTAYKRIENGMFWSKIGSGFKEPGDTAPTENSEEHAPAAELPLSNSELKIQDATVLRRHRKLFVTEKQQSACRKLLARSVAVALRTSNSSFRRCGENGSS